MASLIKNQKQKSILKQLQKIFRDLEKIFKQAITDKSYTAALRAKELQLKELLSSREKEESSKTLRLQHAQDIIDYFNSFDESHLINLNKEFAELNKD